MHRADVVAGLKEVSGETMAKSVRGDMLVDFCKAGGFFDGFLHGGFVEVVAALDTSGGSLEMSGAGKRYCQIQSLFAFLYFRSRA